MQLSSGLSSENFVSNPYVATTSGAATATDWHRAGTEIEAGRATVDLLDANETTWAFAAADRIGSVKNRQVKRLATLASGECCRS